MRNPCFRLLLPPLNAPFSLGLLFGLLGGQIVIWAEVEVVHNRPDAILPVLRLQQASATLLAAAIVRASSKLDLLWTRAPASPAHWADSRRIT